MSETASFPASDNATASLRVPPHSIEAEQAVIGGLLLGFNAISTLMQTGDKYVWKSLSLVDVLGKNNFKWIETISYASIKSAASYVSTMPLYLLLFAIGFLFFLINFVKPKV